MVLLLVSAFLRRNCYYLMKNSRMLFCIDEGKMRRNNEKYLIVIAAFFFGIILHICSHMRCSARDIFNFQCNKSVSSKSFELHSSESSAVKQKYHSTEGGRHHTLFSRPKKPQFFCKVKQFLASTHSLKPTAPRCVLLFYGRRKGLHPLKKRRKWNFTLNWHESSKRHFY